MYVNTCLSMYMTEHVSGHVYGHGSGHVFGSTHGHVYGRAYEIACRNASESVDEQAYWCMYRLAYQHLWQRGVTRSNQAALSTFEDGEYSAHAQTWHMERVRVEKVIRTRGHLLRHVPHTAGNPLSRRLKGVPACLYTCARHASGDADMVTQSC